MNFRDVPIQEIKIGDRVRENAGDIDGLAREIQEVGLLNPISVTPDFRLLAGYRRLQACKLLGWDSIPARVISEVIGEHRS